MNQGRLYSSFYADFDDEEDDDDDEDDEGMIDPDSLGDWRDFRRSLAQREASFREKEEEGDDDEVDRKRVKTKPTSVSNENEEVLSSQNKELAEEYKKGVWAHEVATVS